MNEREIETIIEERLKNLGWIDNPYLPNRNVYKQGVKTEEQKKSLGRMRPDYVLYKENTNDPLIVIEVKNPKESISEALIQGENYARAIKAPIVIATNGISTKTLHIAKQKPLILNKEEVTKLINHSLAVEFVDTNEWFTLEEKVVKSREELLSIFKDINNQLRDAGISTGLPRIELFCNLLFLKVITELSDSKSLIRDIPDWCKWNKIKEKKGEELHSFINGDAFNYFKKSYGGDVLSPIEDLVKPNILDNIVSKLDDLHLSATNTDIKGDAFEYFLRNYGGADTDFGEYFTPRHIVRALVQIINPQFGEKVYDPFCGTGGMLIEAYKHIYDGEWAKTKKNITYLQKQTFYGADITKMYRIAKMNMILAGDGHNNIIRQDSYATPDTIKRTTKKEDEIEEKQNEIIKYDVIITNMPFGSNMKTEYGSLYGFDTKSAEVVGVLHCLRALKDTDNARIGIIVPEGILFRTNNKAYTDLREKIINDYNLETIVSLPQQTFAPNTGVKSSILIIKNKRQPKGHIWYFDVKNDGYTLDSGRHRIDGVNDIDNLLAESDLKVENKERLSKLGFEILPIDKIKKNSFDLVGSKYRTATTHSTNFPLVSLGDDKYFTIFSGGTPNSNIPEYWNGNINWITLADLPIENYITPIYKTERTITAEGLNNSATKLLPVNTVVVSSRATIGRVGIAKTELATNQGFKNIVIKDFSLVLPNYLAYILTAKREDMLNLASGGTFKEISKENFSTIQIPLPPLDIQKQIVEDLESYQHIINGARIVIENYKYNIKIDKKWETVKLGNICDLLCGYAFKSALYSDDGIQIVKIGNVQRDNLVLDKNISFYPVDYSNMSKYILKRGDILISMTGTQGKEDFGNVCMVDIDKKLLLNQRVGKFHNFNKAIKRDYFYFILQTELFRKQIFENSSGIRQGNISKKQIESICIPLPPLETQNKIVNQIKTEKALIEPSKQIIEVFTKKIRDRINELYS